MRVSPVMIRSVVDILKKYRQLGAGVLIGSGAFSSTFIPEIITDYVDSRYVTRAEYNTLANTVIRLSEFSAESGTGERTNAIEHIGVEPGKEKPGHSASGSGH